MEAATGKPIPYKIVPRRPGDVARCGTDSAAIASIGFVGETPHGRIITRSLCPLGSCYCDPSFAEEYLGWKATRGVTEMCADTWRWQSGNPKGYRVEA